MTSIDVDTASLRAVAELVEAALAGLAPQRLAPPAGTAGTDAEGLLARTAQEWIGYLTELSGVVRGTGAALRAVAEVYAAAERDAVRLYPGGDADRCWR